MPAADRPGLIDRLYSAYRAFRGKGDAPSMDYGYPPPSIESVMQRHFGLPPPFKPEQSQQAYSDNPWLKSGIDVIASEVGRTRFRLVRRNEDGEFKEVEHQAAETLKRPQPIAGGKTMLTRLQLFQLLTQHVFLNGEHFWVMDGRDRAGSPHVLAPMNPAFVYLTLTEQGVQDKYVYRFVNNWGKGGDLEIPAEDVVHFRFTNPRQWYRGHSPVQPIRYAIDTYREADELNFNRLKNNAVPPGTLETDQNIPEAERKKLGEQWRQAYGGTTNAGKVPVMPMGLKFNRIGDSNQDMQFIEGKNLTRDEILANLRVGMELLGKTESQTRANAEAAVYVFQRFTVLPVLELIADTLTHDYLPAFPNAEGLEFVFDDPVPENGEDKRAQAQTLFGIGGLTPNEGRKMFGLEPLKDKGTDVPYLPISVLPVGEPHEEDDEVPTDLAA